MSERFALRADEVSCFSIHYIYLNTKVVSIYNIEPILVKIIIRIIIIFFFVGLFGKFYYRLTFIDLK